MACAKHYPGHGHTSEDSHKTLPVILDNEEELYQRELPPFTAAIDAQVASIMPAHVIYAAWDMAHPASCSPNMISGRLRRALMYDGLVITDDLEMDAVKDRYEPHDLILLSFTAGNDFLLACHTFELQEYIVRTLYDGRKANLLPTEGFLQSEKRIDAMMKRFPVPGPGDLSVIGCEEHQMLANQIRERSEESRL
jgi:beta-N-acetylhexosaminidase